MEIATLDTIVKTGPTEKAPSGNALRSDGEIPEGRAFWAEGTDRVKAQRQGYFLHLRNRKEARRIE